MDTTQMAISVIPKVYNLIKTDRYGRQYSRPQQCSTFKWTTKPVYLLKEKTLQGWNTQSNAWVLTTTEGAQPVCKFDGLPTNELKTAMAVAIKAFATLGEPCFLGVAGDNDLDRWFCAIAHKLPGGVDAPVDDVCPWLPAEDE
jgi:hypothetical protein